VVANWSASGYRLPTEMEWMWAAMGARDGTTGYLKSFSGATSNLHSETLKHAWFDENSNGSTHCVATKLPNELGLYDMSGNVYEWCWDLYSTYPTGHVSNYTGATTSNFRIVRGGSWSSPAYDISVANRVWGDPYGQFYNTGFRIVRR